MDMAGLVTPAILGWLAAFLLVMARLSFLVLLMPGIGEQAIPARIRIMVLLGTAALFATSGVMQIPVVSSPTQFLLLMILEGLIGLALGVTVRLSIWMLTVSGTLIANSIGLAQFLGVALEHEMQTVTANLLAMAGAALLLSIDFHVAALAGVIQLYNEIPVGAFSAMDLGYVTSSFFAAFGFAILIAWPFAAVNLLYQISLGFINRALPQLLVAFVGAPFMVGAGVFMLFVSVVTILIVWQERVLDFVFWI